MVDIAGNVAGIVSAVLDVDKCFMYLLNHKSNIRILEREVGKLKVARDEVERKVEVARNNVEMIEEIVEQWVIKVNSIVPESETLIKERANVRCFSLKARYKQSRKASKKVQDVAELLHLQEAFGDQEDEAWRLFRKMTVFDFNHLDPQIAMRHYAHHAEVRQSPTLYQSPLVSASFQQLRT
ncbi:hypothetical protein Pint_20029 [Pistacia integerrima]|uniref:Uncharacterized protein n=1 Tax=Pistacia integerrima TaxID=434235 RepID=A0ACC0XAG1_9ROSI|nr:hypothetical protein Pint_20029 [Pistacia integerrima]